MSYPQDRDFAYRAESGAVIDASAMDPVAWRGLQTSYRVGELEMPCCRAPAVPKTSPNGLQFFAHQAGACQSSPESQWHLQAKQTVRDTARSLGYHAELERPGHTGSARWCADVWIETTGVPWVVELQHSYQHLRDYVARQQRYSDAGLRCLWLLMAPRYHTLLTSMMKVRFREEFDRNASCFDTQGACVRGVPIGVLDLEHGAMVRGPGLHMPLASVLEAFAQERFAWHDGRWLVAAETAQQ